MVITLGLMGFLCDGAQLLDRIRGISRAGKRMFCLRWLQMVNSAPIGIRVFGSQWTRSVIETDLKVMGERTGSLEVVVMLNSSFWAGRRCCSLVIRLQRQLVIALVAAAWSHQGLCPT